MTKRAPGLQQERLYRVLIHHLGSARPMSLVVALLFLMAFSWATDIVYTIAEGILGSWTRWAAFGLFVILVLAFILAARRSAARFRPRVLEDASPIKVRGLILFLSVIESKYGQQIKEYVTAAELSLDSFRQSFGRLAWRMPVEAIAYHRGRLRHVVVITSHNRDNNPGSYEQLPLFRDLVLALFPGDLEVLDLGDCGAGHTAGLDFEQDIDGLTQATDNAFQLLTERRLRAADILIDVTGGTKPSTIAGASVALAEGRRVQYVSTSDYRIRTYDVTYEPET